MNKYLFHGSLENLDPNVHELIEIEAERQYRRLIMIPSESTGSFDCEKIGSQRKTGCRTCHRNTVPTVV
jgi:hypothetical protein